MPGDDTHVSSPGIVVPYLSTAGVDQKVRQSPGAPPMGRASLSDRSSYARSEPDSS